MRLMRPCAAWAAALLLGSGCTPVYIAPAVNAPLFSASHELQAAAYSGTNGVDAQVAFAPAKHVGVIATGSFKTGQLNRHTYGNIGAGYFDAPLHHLRVEAFGGAGYGTSVGGVHTSAGDVREGGDYVRGFIQGDVGFVSNIIGFGFALRFSGVNYNYNSKNGKLVPLRAQGSGSAFDTFAEPTAIFRVGYKWVKFETQLGLVYPLSNEPVIESNPFLLHFTMGLRFQLGGFFSRRHD